MPTRFDLLLVDNDLYISNQGDFVIAPSDQQHISDTINAFPGWWKEFPAQGFGLRSYLGASVDPQVISKNLRLQLNADGYTVANPKVTLAPNGDLLINPNATPA